MLAYSVVADYTISPFLNHIGMSHQYLPLIRSSVIYIPANLLFPIAGWIADAWAGRYHMMHFSLLLLWFGYIILALIQSVSEFSTMAWNVYLLPLSFVVTSIGSAGFRATAIPLGADLISYRTSQELSSYFYCYYWIRNFGFMIYLFPGTCSNPDRTIETEVYIMTAVICISLALTLNACFKNYFKMNRERINPYKKVIEVLYSAAIVKRPRNRSAFSYAGALPPSRMNLTKVVHGGKFSNEDVEDVKAFVRLLLVLPFILFAQVVYTGVSIIILLIIIMNIYII